MPTMTKGEAMMDFMAPPHEPKATGPPWRSGNALSGPTRHRGGRVENGRMRRPQ